MSIYIYMRQLVTFDDVNIFSSLFSDDGTQQAPAQPVLADAARSEPPAIANAASAAAARADPKRMWQWSARRSARRLTRMVLKLSPARLSLSAHRAGSPKCRACLSSGASSP